MRKMKFMGVPFLLFGLAAVAVLGFVTASLWNALMPPILDLPTISFWQALGLFLLSRILFGRFGGGWGDRMRKSRAVHGWKDLTPEEKDRFRCAMGPGWRHDPDQADDKAKA